MEKPTQDVDCESTSVPVRWKKTNTESYIIPDRNKLYFTYNDKDYSFATLRSMDCQCLMDLRDKLEKELSQLQTNHLVTGLCLHNVISCIILDKQYKS